MVLLTGLLQTPTVTQCFSGSGRLRLDNAYLHWAKRPEKKQKESRVAANFLTFKSSRAVEYSSYNTWWLSSVLHM